MMFEKTGLTTGKKKNKALESKVKRTKATISGIQKLALSKR